MTVKRYSIMTDVPGDYWDEEDQHGNYVTYTDHAAALTERDRRWREKVEAVARRMQSELIVCHTDPPCEGCNDLMGQRDDHVDQLRKLLEDK